MSKQKKKNLSKKNSFWAMRSVVIGSKWHADWRSSCQIVKSLDENKAMLQPLWCGPTQDKAYLILFGLTNCKWQIYLSNFAICSQGLHLGCTPNHVIDYNTWFIMVYVGHSIWSHITHSQRFGKFILFWHVSFLCIQDMSFILDSKTIQYPELLRSL